MTFGCPLLIKLIQGHMTSLPLSLLSLSLSLPAAGSTQYFVHLSFNSALPLISSISSDLQKLLKYFNDTAIDAFCRI